MRAVASGARCRSSWRRSRGPRRPRPGRRGCRPSASSSQYEANCVIATASCQQRSSSLPSSTGGLCGPSADRLAGHDVGLDLLGRRRLLVSGRSGPAAFPADPPTCGPAPIATNEIRPRPRNTGIDASRRGHDRIASSTDGGARPGGRRRPRRSSRRPGECAPPEDVEDSTAADAHATPVIRAEPGVESSRLVSTGAAIPPTRASSSFRCISSCCSCCCT